MYTVIFTERAAARLKSLPVLAKHRIKLQVEVLIGNAVPEGVVLMMRCGDSYKFAEGDYFLASRDIYCVTVDRFRLYYQVDKKTVTVLRIREIR